MYKSGSYGSEGKRKQFTACGIDVTGCCCSPNVVPLRFRRLRFFIWLPFLYTYRTMCNAPEPAFRRILEDIRELRFAA